MPRFNTQEQIVQKCAAETMQHIKEGLAPTEALAKVASNHNLNKHFTHTVSSVVNTTLSHIHFKTAADRSSDFDISNSTEAFKLATSMPAKKAAFENKTFNTVIDYNRYLYDAEFQSNKVKIASFELPKNKIAKASLLKTAAAEIHELRKQAAATRAATSLAETNAMAASHAVINAFKKNAHYRSPFHIFETQVYKDHGVDSKPLVDFIYKSANLKEDRGVDQPWAVFDKKPKEAALFDKFVKKSQAYKEALAEQESAEDLFKEATEIYAEAIKDVSLSEKSAGELPMDSVPDPEPEADASEETNTMDDVVNRAVDKQAESMFSAAGKNMEKFSPDYIQKRPNIDNLHRKMLFQDLMMTDPIISNHDPYKVMDVYEQVLRLAPRLADQKEVMRSQLRQALEGQGLDVFAANQMTDTEGKITKLRNPTPAQK